MGKIKRFLFAITTLILICLVFNGHGVNAAEMDLDTYKVTIDMGGHGEDIVFNVDKGTMLYESDVTSRDDLKAAVANDPAYGGVRLKPVSEFSDLDDFFLDYNRNWRKQITEDTRIYVCWLKVIDKVVFSVKTPACGTETKLVEGGISNEQTYKPEVIVPSGAGYDTAIIKYQDGRSQLYSFWFDEEGYNTYDYFEGKFIAGNNYIGNTDFDAIFPYTFSKDTTIEVNGVDEFHSCGYSSRNKIIYRFSTAFTVTPTHDWDEGKVTKEATSAAEGEKTFTCKGCGATRTETIDKLPDDKPDPTDPNKKGEDGTPYGKGASKAAVDKAITSLESEVDPPGTSYGLLQLKVTKTTKNSVTVKWQKVVGAKTYMVYASNCGKKNKCVKVAELGSGKTTFTVNKKTLKKAIKKGTYYKVWVAALDKDDMVITTSKVVHGATKGGKVGDHKKVTTKAKKNKVSIKAKKTFKLKAKAIAKSKKLKVKKHRGIKYESSNPTVATVNAKGVIKGVKKGTCYVYAYAQNGVAAKIKVTVK